MGERRGGSQEDDRRDGQDTLNKGNRVNGLCALVPVSFARTIVKWGQRE
jgi:hypothetical protein